MHYLVTSLLAATATLSSFLVAVHLGFRPPRRIERGTPARLGLPYREVRIPTMGDKRLFAWWLPAESSAPCIILLHGWGGNAELMLPLAVPFHRAGLNVLLLDARNHGNSDAASFSSLPRFAEDLSAAIDWLHGNGTPPSGKLVLLGHSVGAGAVLFEASRRNDIAAVISIAAFAHPEWMMRRYLRRLHIPQFAASAVLRYVELVIGYRFADIAPMNTLCRVPCPVLLVHGRTDQTVPVSDALAIRANCPHKQVELLLVDAAGHDSVDVLEKHGRQLIAFLERAAVLGR